MNTLWTPWRMEHILGSTDSPDGCLFEPPGKESFSKAHLLLYRDQDSLCLINRFPYANGHLLVAPIKHVSCITELTAEEMVPLMNLVGTATTILRQHLQPDGFNIGLNIGSEAGAGIADHLHFHVVPRWRGDHNFMTVLADIRTIPEHIQVTFDKLLPDFQTYHQSNFQKDRDDRTA